MNMHNPAHPGEILKHDIIDALDITVTEAAKHLGVSRKHLSSICNGHNAIAASLAIRLEKVFGAPTAEAWMKMQAAHDLWVATEKGAGEGFELLAACA